MRVALNGTSLLSPLTGVGQYTHHLAKELLKNPEIELGIFYGTRWESSLVDTPPQEAVAMSKFGKKFVPKARIFARLFKQFMFSRGVQNSSFDLYHDPNFLALKFSGRTVITVHDLSWIRFPDTHPADRVAEMNQHFVPALKKASSIITDSEFVKREIIDQFGIEPDLIRPIMLGVEELFHPMSAQETEAARTSHSLHHGKYLLAVGTLEPRKNLTTALTAFMQLPEAIRKEFPLVLVGMKGWRTSDLERQLAPLISAGHIKQLGYLAREELAALIAGARCLVYPSIYEGFGLPPLEAMACGVPVISTQVASIPEVVGDTGILVAPHDAAEFANAMFALISDDTLHVSLSLRALQRSKDFTWKRCADETVEVYRKVLATPLRPM